MISNLYADLLINDRLQRSAGLDMAGVYKQLGPRPRRESRLWTALHADLRGAVEPPARRTGPRQDRRPARPGRPARRPADPQLREGLARGGGRFAALCLPYLIADDEKGLHAGVPGALDDTRCAGSGGFPDGLTEIEDGELTAPSTRPKIRTCPASTSRLRTQTKPETPSAARRAQLSGRKTAKNYRQPFEYAEVLKAAGVDLDVREITARYYRELAMPHLIPFPVKHLPQATDPLPEGLDVWDVDTPLEQIDWLGTLLTSPDVIPGVTTRQRHYGDSPAHRSRPRSRRPVPRRRLLRLDGRPGAAACRIRCWPGRSSRCRRCGPARGSRWCCRASPARRSRPTASSATQSVVLQTLASYLGTGYSFGIHRLAETFAAADRGPATRTYPDRQRQRHLLHAE